MSLKRVRTSIETQLVLLVVIALMALATGLQVMWNWQYRMNLIKATRMRSQTIAGAINNTIEAVRPLINSLEDITELNTYLQGMVAQNANVDFIAVTWLDGTVVFHSSREWQGAVVSALAQLPDAITERRPVPGFGEVYLTARTVPGRDLVGPDAFQIIVAVPVEVIDTQIMRAGVISAALTGLAVLIVSVVFFVVLRRNIVQPLRQLASMATRIGAGELSLRVPLERGDEIGQLATTFNLMATQLADLINTLEQRVMSRTRDLEAASRVAQVTTTTLDLDLLLERIVLMIGQQYDFHSVCVFLLSKEDNTLQCGASAQKQGGGFVLVQRAPVDLEHSQHAVAEAARTVNVVFNPEARRRDGDAFQGSQPVVADFAIPMQVGSAIIGVVYVQVTDLGQLDIATRRMLETLTEQIAIAVRNAQLFAEAQDARKLAEEASRIKSQFLASMSHELRTPLNAILNFTEFVLDGALGPVNEEQVATLAKVIDSAEHLLSLINDILDVTKIEVGMMSLLVEPYDLARLIKSVEASGHALLRTRRRDVTLSVSIPENLPTMIGDRRRVRQVLLNLLANAVKFTEEGEIRLRVAAQDQEVHLVVEDTGVGIDPQEQAVIFEYFRQAQAGLMAEGGAGLGLPICKYLVEAHGGSIAVRSTPGQGTVVEVILPIDARPFIARDSSSVLVAG
ncbi:MAG: hypothetical protein Kow0077_07400 [Anaerolineae bacterium]